ncbi:MAG: hypothetical protein WC278_01280 [Bacilli bacterium]|nr:hypothetical protein [Bacilli bacterium]MDD3121566.1 hypothetical protein [Bacilli bacterium]MDD4062837.1 hypothetical protein [Bacilli bacterium]MDD4482208.1 hypothetical protein [Bacilli bacterium]MDD5182887.1 hypothetical protein [Bacilli bacterium]
MFLSISDILREVYDNFFVEFSWSSLLTLFFGILIGILFCLMTYLVFITVRFKNDKSLSYIKEVDISNDDLKRSVTNARNQYIEECSYLKSGEKIVKLKDISLSLIDDIALFYYPDSKHPKYELSISEALLLTHYIADRIDTIFKGPILKRLKEIKISSILNVLDAKKIAEENKIVKTVTNTKVRSFFRTVGGVLNYVNPVYWIKKLMIDATFTAALNKISLTIIDIIAEETNRVYSKSLFVDKLNLDIDNSAEEIQRIIEEDEENKNETK